MRRRTVLVGFTIAVAAISIGTVAFARSGGEDYFGLRTISQPYRGRIERVIQLSAAKSRALAASGFKVYTLDSITRDEMGTRFYIWRDTMGAKTVTKPFVAPGSILMMRGQSYVGTRDVLWLTIYQDGDEQKFSLVR